MCSAGAHTKGPTLETSHSKNVPGHRTSHSKNDFVCHELFSDMCETFSAVGRLVLWDVLCRGMFCAVGRFVPWDVLCHGTFRDGTF